MNSTDEQVERICKEIECQRQQLGLTPLPRKWMCEPEQRASSLLQVAVIAVLLAGGVLFWSMVVWLARMLF